MVVWSTRYGRRIPLLTLPNLPWLKSMRRFHHHWMTVDGHMMRKLQMMFRFIQFQLLFDKKVHEFETAKSFIVVRNFSSGGHKIEVRFIQFRCQLSFVSGPLLIKKQRDLIPLRRSAIHNKFWVQNCYIIVEILSSVDMKLRLRFIQFQFRLILA